MLYTSYKQYVNHPNKEACLQNSVEQDICLEKHQKELLQKHSLPKQANQVVFIFREANKQTMAGIFLRHGAFLWPDARLYRSTLFHPALNQRIFIAPDFCFQFHPGQAILHERSLVVLLYDCSIVYDFSFAAGGAKEIREPGITCNIPGSLYCCHVTQPMVCGTRQQLVFILCGQYPCFQFGNDGRRKG